MWYRNGSWLPMFLTVLTEPLTLRFPFNTHTSIMKPLKWPLSHAIISPCSPAGHRGGHANDIRTIWHCWLKLFRYGGIHKIHIHLPKLYSRPFGNVIHPTLSCDLVRIEITSFPLIQGLHKQPGLSWYAAFYRLHEENHYSPSSSPAGVLVAFDLQYGGCLRMTSH